MDRRWAISVRTWVPDVDVDAALGEPTDDECKSDRVLQFKMPCALQENLDGGQAGGRNWIAAVIDGEKGGIR